MFSFIKRLLSSERGTASAIRSTSYQNFDILKRPYPSVQRLGSLIVISDSHTVGSGTYVTGSSENASGTVQLFVHRAGWKCLEAIVSTDGLGASAGAGVTLAIGNGTTADKYVTATDFDAANIARLNATGHHYTPTADVIVTSTYAAVVPVAGQHFYYTFLFTS